MDEKDLQALFEALKKQNIFSSIESMKSVIDKEGAGVLYSMVPEGMFGSEEEFTNTFSAVKKKDETVGLDSKSENTTTTSGTEATQEIPVSGSSDSSTEQIPPPPEEVVEPTEPVTKKGIIKYIPNPNFDSTQPVSQDNPRKIEEVTPMATTPTGQVVEVEKKDVPILIEPSKEDEEVNDVIKDMSQGDIQKNKNYTVYYGETGINVGNEVFNPAHKYDVDSPEYQEEEYSSFTEGEDGLSISDESDPYSLGGADEVDYVEFIEPSEESVELNAKLNDDNNRQKIITQITNKEGEDYNYDYSLDEILNTPFIYSGQDDYLTEESTDAKYYDYSGDTIYEDLEMGVVEAKEGIGRLVNQENIQSLEGLQVELEKKMSPSNASAVIEEATYHAERNIDNTITEQGNYYLDKEDIEKSDAFTKWREAERELELIDYQINRYNEFDEEKKARVNEVFKKEKGVSFEQYYKEQAIKQDDLRSKAAAEYQTMTGAEGTQLYNPATGEMINIDKAPEQVIQYNENVTQNAEHLLESVDNDVAKLEDIRNQAYFDLLFIARKARENWDDIVWEGNSYWDIATGFLSPLVGGDAEDLVFSDQDKTWAKNIPDEGFEFKGKLKHMRSTSPAARVYNEKLDEFIIANKALVLNKNYLLEAEAEPSSGLEYFAAGIRDGLGMSGETELVKADGVRFIEVMEEAGFRFTDEEKIKLEKTWDESLLHMGGTMIPFLAEVALTRGVGNATKLLDVIKKIPIIIGSRNKSRFIRNFATIVGAGLEEGLVLSASDVLFETGMGMEEGIVLAGGATTFQLLGKALMNIPLVRKLPNLVRQTMEGQIKIGGGMVGMYALDIAHELATGKEYGEAINEAFGGDNKLEKMIQIYLLTAAIQVSKLSQQEKLWREALFADIKGRWGIEYGQVSDNVRKAYNDLDLDINATEAEIIEAYEKKVLKASNEEGDYKTPKEIQDLHELTLAYKTVIEYQGKKAKLGEVIEEIDKNNEQDRKNEKRYDKARNLKREPMISTEVDGVGKMEIPNPNELMDYKDAKYWGELTDAEIQDTYKQIEADVKNGKLSSTEGKDIVVQIQTGRNTYTQLKLVPKEFKQEYYDLDKQKQQIEAFIAEAETLEANTSMLESLNKQLKSTENKIKELENKINESNKKDTKKEEGVIEYIPNPEFDYTKPVGPDNPRRIEVVKPMAETPTGEVDAIEVLKNEGIENPTQEQIDTKIEELKSKEEIKPEIQEEVKEEVKEEVNVDEEIEKARAGDKDAQAKLDEYGLSYEYEPYVRFVSESEVDALNKGETIEGKNDAGVDVTRDVDLETSSPTDADYRINFKEKGFDDKKSDSRIRPKGDKDGWITEGYDINDVATIEKKNPDGSWEVVYEAKAETKTEAVEEPTAETKPEVKEEVKTKEAALEELVNSEEYENATDREKDVMFKDVSREYGEPIKRSVTPKEAIEMYEREKTEETAEGAEETPVVKEVKEVALDDYYLLLERIKIESKAGKDVKKLYERLIKETKKYITSTTPYKGKVKYTTRDFKQILKAIQEANLILEKSYTDKTGKKIPARIEGLQETLDKVIEIVEKRKKKYVVAHIEKWLNPQAALTKSKKGKIPPESQRELDALRKELEKDYIEEGLESLELNELEEIAKRIDDIYAEGHKKQKETNLEKRKKTADDKGKNLEALYKAEGNEGVKLETIEDIEAFLGEFTSASTLTTSKEKLGLDKGELVEPNGETLNDNIEIVSEKISKLESQARGGKDVSKELIEARKEKERLENKRDELPTKEELETAYKAKVREIEESGKSDSKKESELNSVEKAKETIEKEIKLRESEGKDKSQNPVVIIDGRKITPRDLDLIEEGFTDATGYTRVSSTSKKKTVAQKLKSFSALPANMMNIRTLLGSIVKGDKQLAESTSKLADDITTATRKEEAKLIQFNKKLKKAKERAKVTFKLLGTSSRSTSKEVVVGKIGKGSGTSTDIFMKDKVAVTNDVAVYFWQMLEVNGPTRLERSGVDVEKLKEYMNLPENKNLKKYADELFDMYKELKLDYEKMFEEVTGRAMDIYDIDPGTGKQRRYAPTLVDNLIKEAQELTKLLDEVAPGSGSIFADALKARNQTWTEIRNKEGELVLDKNGNIQYERNITGEISHSGATSTILDYVKTMEHTKQFIEIEKQLRNIVNSDTKGLIQQRIGKKKYAKLMQIMDNILLQNSEFKTAEKIYLNYINRAGVLTRLAGKLPNIIKQTTSSLHWLGAGIEYGVPPGKVLRGIVDAIATKEGQQIASDLIFSDMIKDRLTKGNIDPELSRQLYKLKKSGLNLKTRLGMASEILSKIAMAPTIAGDIAGVLLGGIPFKVALEKQFIKEGMDPKEAREKSDDIFYRKMNEVQQSDKLFARGTLQDTIEGRLLATTFKTAQSQAMNRLSQAAQKIRQWKNLSERERAQAVYNLAYYSVFNYAFATVSSGMLAYQLGMMDHTEDEVTRMKYNRMMDTFKANLQGLGFTGLVAENLINIFEGKPFFNDIMSKKFYDDVLNLVAQVHTKKHKDAVINIKDPDFPTLTDEEQKEMYENLDAGTIELLGKHVFDAIEAFKEGKLLPYTFGAKMKFYKSPYENQIFKYIYGESYNIEEEEEGEGDVIEGKSFGGSDDNG